MVLNPENRVDGQPIKSSLFAVHSATFEQQRYFAKRSHIFLT